MISMLACGYYTLNNFKLNGIFLIRNEQKKKSSTGLVIQVCI